MHFFRDGVTFLDETTRALRVTEGKSVFFVINKGNTWKFVVVQGNKSKSCIFNLDMSCMFRTTAFAQNA